jgi:hypothetical protein
MKTYGAVIYSSQWQGWVPGDCGSGDLGSSQYTIKNLKITGRVVQGPEPRLCNPSPTPPPTPPPTPSPPPPTPTPAGDCPGGSLSACIGMCPSDSPKAFQVCVQVCTERCQGGGAACTGVDDGKDLASCVTNCPSDADKFQTCVDCCSNKFPSSSLV